MPDSATTPTPDNRYLSLAGTARRVVTRRVEAEDKVEIDRRLHPVLAKLRQLKRLKASFGKLIGGKIAEAETALERLDAAWRGKERPVLAECRIEIDARGLGQLRVVDNATDRLVFERPLTSKEREAHFQGRLFGDDGVPVIPELKDQHRPDDAIAAAEKVLEGEMTVSDLHKLVQEAEKDPSAGDEEDEEEAPKPKERKPRAKKEPAAAAAPAPAANGDANGAAKAAPVAPAPVPVAASEVAAAAPANTTVPAPAAAAAAAPAPEEPAPGQLVLDAAKRAGEMGIGLIVGDLPADVVREAAAAWTERGAFSQVAEDRWVYVPRPSESFRITLADSSELVVPVGSFFAFPDMVGGYEVLGLDGDRVRVKTDGAGEEAVIPLADFAEQVRGGKLKFMAARPAPDAPEAHALARDPEPAGDLAPLERGEELAARVDTDASPEPAALAATPAPEPQPAPPPAPELAADLRAETKAEVLELMRERGAAGLVLDDVVDAFAERSGTKADKLPPVLSSALPVLLRELAVEGALASEEPGAEVKDPRGALFWIADVAKPAYPAAKKKKKANAPK